MGEPIKEDASLMNNSFFLAVRDKDFIKTNLRYCVLVFASLLNLGNFFVYDNPAALQTQLENVIYI